MLAHDLEQIFIKLDAECEPLVQAKDFPRQEENTYVPGTLGALELLAVSIDGKVVGSGLSHLEETDMRDSAPAELLGLDIAVDYVPQSCLSSSPLAEQIIQNLEAFEHPVGASNGNVVFLGQIGRQKRQGVHQVGVDLRPHLDVRLLLVPGLLLVVADESAFLRMHNTLFNTCIYDFEELVRAGLCVFIHLIDRLHSSHAGYNNLKDLLVFPTLVSTNT